MSIPSAVSISDLPALPSSPSGVGSAGKEVPSANFNVTIAKADQAFGKDFDKAKSTLVAAQGTYTAAKQAYALAVATYNSSAQQARATQIDSYQDADDAFSKATGS